MLTVFSVLSNPFVIVLNDSRNRLYVPSATPVELMTNFVKVASLVKVTKFRSVPIF